MRLEDCRRAELYYCNHTRTKYYKLVLLNLMFNIDMWQEVIVGTYQSKLIAFQD